VGTTYLTPTEGDGMYDVNNTLEAKEYDEN